MPPPPPTLSTRYVSKADLDGQHQDTLAWHKKTNPQSDVKPTRFQLTHYTEANVGHM